VYLTSNDDFTKNPSWILGTKPDANGKTGNAITSAVIVADKGNGLVDAFYFYFNSFDNGGIVLEQNLGNHVGDWEHNMVRFQNGIPQAIWYSQHSGGQSFKYQAVMKDSAGLRVSLETNDEKPVLIHFVAYRLLRQRFARQLRPPW
jgi:hypothetical protein